MLEIQNVSKTFNAGTVNEKICTKNKECKTKNKRNKCNEHNNPFM